MPVIKKLETQPVILVPSKPEKPFSGYGDLEEFKNEHPMQV